MASALEPWAQQPVYYSYNITYLLVLRFIFNYVYVYHIDGHLIVYIH